MRKRSKYKPRPIVRDPLNYVLAGFKPISEKHQQTVAAMHHSALESLTHGTAKWSDWDVVRNMINTAVALSQTVYGNAYLDDLKAAMVAHAKCGRRFLDGKSLGYTGEELQAINTAVEIVTEQFRLSTVAEIERAAAVVHHSERTKNFYASVVQGRAITDKELPV